MRTLWTIGFLIVSANTCIAQDITILERTDYAVCDRALLDQCRAMEGRLRLTNRPPLQFFVLKCAPSVCRTKILHLKDLALTASIKVNFETIAYRNSFVFVGTGGFRAKVETRLVPDGLLITNSIVIEALAPRYSRQTGKPIGGVFHVDSNGRMFIERYSDFSTAHRAISPVFAIQSPTVLVYDAQRDHDLGTQVFSDRSAVGISSNGDFMYFLVLTINESSGKAPTHNAVTLTQFADIILHLSQEVGVRLERAINLEGYSYPFVFIPKGSRSVGLNEKKVMPSVFALEESSR